MIPHVLCLMYATKLYCGGSSSIKGNADTCNKKALHFLMRTACRVLVS